VSDIIDTITFLALMFKITILCNSYERRVFSRILIQKLFLEGNCSNECTKELKMFSLQLQMMKFQDTACGFFLLNLRFFTTFVSVIVSYVIIMVQIK
jgi:hypothetical protein